MENKIFIGIDPGWSGAVAYYSSEYNFQTYSKCPGNIGAMSELIKTIKRNNNSCYAVLEKVHSFPKQGVASTWTFAENFGAWQGILEAHKIKYTLTDPRQWQKFILGRFIPGHSKEASLARARENYPALIMQIGKNHNIADALNLLTYCKMIYG